MLWPVDEWHAPPPTENRKPPNPTAGHYSHLIPGRPPFLTPGQAPAPHAREPLTPREAPAPLLRLQLALLLAADPDRHGLRGGGLSSCL